MDSASVADVSAWGKISFKGPDRHKALHGLLTNDILSLGPGAGVETCVLTPKGKLVADFMLYNLGDELLSVQLSQATARIQEALKKPLMLTDTIMKESPGPAWLVLGPGAKAAVAGGLPFPRFAVDGVLLLGKNAPALPRLDAEALETLRIEAGIPIVGIDTDEETLPLELPLEQAISFTKGCYMGQETTARMKNFGHANRRLVGIKMETPAAAGTSVLFDGKAIGRITSVARSPRLGADLALAMLRNEHAAPGTRVSVGEVVKLPL